MEDTQLLVSVFSFKSVFPENKSISFSGKIEGANKVLGGEQRKGVEKECLTTQWVPVCGMGSPSLDAL